MKALRGQSLHLLQHTRRMAKGLVGSQCDLGKSLRLLLDSPHGSSGEIRPDASGIFPLPVTFRGVSDFKTVFHNNLYNNARTKQRWMACTGAWELLMVLTLNVAAGHRRTGVWEPSSLQKGVLNALRVDAFRFVWGRRPSGSQVESGRFCEDGHEDVTCGLMIRKPDCDWGCKLGQLSLSYSGEVCEKAMWLTAEQVVPGLPPPGFGGSLHAVDFCSSWVRKHLEDPGLSRLSDDEVPDPLPYAVVRATQQSWEEIAGELVKRGIACMIPPEDIEECRGSPILNGAFGVVKPGKFVEGPGSAPVLRLIMDFRAANCVHRMLPGDVQSLVGPSKWQAIVMTDGQVLASSGDDLTACFYLFQIPYCWSKFFAFRKQVRRGSIGAEGPPDELVYIASRVIPMGWSAAVTVVQHIHRSMALGDGGLPPSREIHREKPMPQEIIEQDSQFWNLYIDDLSILEVMQESAFEAVSSDAQVSPLQAQMREIYRRCKVPYSESKSESRVLASEKLGALIAGGCGILGVSQGRCLDLISLGMFLMGLDMVPTRWIQIFLGKYVHVMQFRRPLFGLVEKLWSRVSKFSAGPLRPGEVTEVWSLLLLLPLCYTDLKARISGTVTASDASEWGGGMTASVGLSEIGRRGLWSQPGVGHGIRCKGETSEVVAIEWFAGIGGLSRALERLDIHPLGVAVCEQDPFCLKVLRNFIPGCCVWKDIRTVQKKDIKDFLDAYPNAQGVVQGGGSPCQGLSQLNVNRLHFADQRSNLFFELKRVMDLVSVVCAERGMWHLSFVENVVCDEGDQAVFRELTGWPQYLLCSGDMSHVRRPRFFWINADLGFAQDVVQEPGNEFMIIRGFGEKEKASCWVAPYWKWVSEEEPVALPTFTRSIPRSRPPCRPAGIGHTPREAQRRWQDDRFRYPPYTYKVEYCLTNHVELRVCGASEREALMGFRQGHTAVKVGSGRLASQDERCAAVGNSFHTGAVALLLKLGLEARLPGVELPSLEEILASHQGALDRNPKELFDRVLTKHVNTTWDEAAEELESQSCTLDVVHPGRINGALESQLVRRLVDLLGYRGTDIHLDTLSFFRADRLPRASIDARQWKWKVVKGWRWRFEGHINVLELEALYRSLVRRFKGGRLFHTRCLHLVDSQVVLGVVAKGRSSSRKLSRVLRRVNLLLLASHCQLILGWVRTELNPADAPSRWYAPLS